MIKPLIYLQKKHNLIHNNLHIKNYLIYFNCDTRQIESIKLVNPQIYYNLTLDYLINKKSDIYTNYDGFVAPEVENKRNFSEKSDVWDIAIIIIQVLTCLYLDIERDNIINKLDNIKSIFKINEPTLNILYKSIIQVYIYTTQTHTTL